jgi:L-malate glycosyltransferase
MIRVLHLTAHLGGGVGKALSGLVVQAASSCAGVRHTIVTLEEQEKPQFFELARSQCEVVVSPSRERLFKLIEATDIVQLEWWNHPATMKALCSGPLPPMRLLVWSHVSGLFNPIIPRRLIDAAHRVLFTSPCSYEARNVADLAGEERDKTGVVSSSGGFAGLPPPQEGCDRLVAGYIGSLNFAKLHPRFVHFLAAARIPGFRVRMIGDVTNREMLEEQCVMAGRPGMLEFRGYAGDVASELTSINVLAYLLNPLHYGTTENALLEAMAMGIVPIVLNNPAERCIVDDQETGIIVNTPDEFAFALQWLSENPQQRRTMGGKAAATVRERFSVEKMEASLNSQYNALSMAEKRPISFADIFGADPADWFLSCQGYPDIFTDSRVHFDRDDFLSYGMLETSKGTVFHFQKHFPDNLRLDQWSQKLQLPE